VIQRARPKRDVSSRAARRLHLAKAAVSHTKQHIPEAGNQQEALAETGYNSWMRMVVARNPALWDFSRLDRMPDDTTLTAAMAERAHGGSCLEHAVVAFAYLRAHARGEYIRQCYDAGEDHSFVLIGEEDEGDSEVAVADAWPSRAKACLWDDFSTYSNPPRFMTVKRMVADGRDSVDDVSSRIRLNRAGRFIVRWDLDGLRTRGIDHLAQSLADNGINLGQAPITYAEVFDGLQRFAQRGTRGMDDWPEARLELWCASQVDHAVLRNLFHDRSAHPADAISSGISQAKNEGRLDKVWSPDDSESVSTFAGGVELRYRAPAGR
jgi:hypothetical protein